jgi:SnoaL-like domain
VLRAGGDPDRATARLYICELRQDAASGRSTQAFGVYRDEYRRVDGDWRFARRDYQSLARSGRGETFSFPEDAFRL